MIKMIYIITKVVQLIWGSTAYICCVVLPNSHVKKWSIKVSDKNLNMTQIRSELCLLDTELLLVVGTRWGLIIFIVWLNLMVLKLHRLLIWPHRDHMIEVCQLRLVKYHSDFYFAKVWASGSENIVLKWLARDLKHNDVCVTSYISQDTLSMSLHSNISLKSTLTTQDMNILVCSSDLIRLEIQLSVIYFPTFTIFNKRGHTLLIEIYRASSNLCKFRLLHLSEGVNSVVFQPCHGTVLI